MDKTKVKLLRDAILPVIKEKAKELEVAVDGSMNGRYDDSSVTFKFSLVDVDEKGEFESESVKNFKIYAAVNGLPEDMLEKVYINNDGDAVKVVGFKSRSPKYPVIYQRLSNGGRYKTSARNALSWEEVK